MNCREFQKLIPDIIERKVRDGDLKSLLSHLESCKDCYDELEIYYVLQYGLGENDNKASMDFIGQLTRCIGRMKQRLKVLERFWAFFVLIQITANTAIVGALVFFVFKYLI